MRPAIAAGALAFVFALGTAALGQVGIERKVLDLQLKTLDLVLAVEAIDGAAAEIGGPMENLQVTETETEIRIELSGDVLFDFDKADIRAEAEPVLTRVSEVLKQHPDAAVMIAGYTDAKGSDTYNLALSEQRAASVKLWLVKNAGVDGSKLTTKGLGEADPVAPNINPDGSDNPEGRQKNRRVEIALRK